MDALCTGCGAAAADEDLEQDEGGVWCEQCDGELNDWDSCEVDDPDDLDEDWC